MVLEQSITLILEQALLSLTDPRFVLKPITMQYQADMTQFSYMQNRIKGQATPAPRARIGTKLIY